MSRRPISLICDAEDLINTAENLVELIRMANAQMDPESQAVAQAATLILDHLYGARDLLKAAKSLLAENREPDIPIPVVRTAAELDALKASRKAESAHDVTPG